MKFASLGERIGAVVVDVILVSIFALLWNYGFLFILGRQDSFSTSIWFLVFMMLVFCVPLVATISYFILGASSAKGQTLGKAVFKIKVESEDGSKLGLRRGVLRFISLLGITFVPFGQVGNAGLILAGDKKQGLHDQAVNSVVIKL